MRVQLSSEAIQAAVKLFKKSASYKNTENTCGSTVLHTLRSHFMDILVSFCPLIMSYIVLLMNWIYVVST